MSPGTENPLLKRLVQLYLAGGQTVEQLVIDADLDPRDRKRVQFFLENLIQATAPSNVPLVNPASAKAVIDTAGLSLVRGGKQLAQDLASAPRIPEMVDGSGFVLGDNIAATPGGVVFRNEVLELIQYAPQTDEVYEVPALVVPPTINKFYAIDLAPERSLVEFGVRQGRQMFVISWRNPDSRHASWNLDTYVRAVLDALDAVEEITGSEQTVLGGVCSGGILASIAAAYLAGIGRQDRLAALCLAVTVIDNHDAGTASALVDERLAGRAKAKSARKGYLDGRALAEVFAWLRPGDLVWNYWVNNYLLGKRPPAFDILFWNSDTTRMTAALHADFVDLAMENSLTRPGALTVLGVPIDLGKHHGGLLRGGRHRRPHHPVGELLPQRPALRRHDPVRAVHQWPHRRPGQPAGQPQGVLPHQRRPDRPTPRSGSRAPTSTRAPGGPTSACGSTNAAARVVRRPRRSGRTACPCSRRRPAPTSSTSDQVPPGPRPRPRRSGGRPPGHGTRPTAGALQRHRRQPRPAPAVRRRGRPTDRGGPVRRTRRGWFPGAQGALQLRAAGMPRRDAPRPARLRPVRRPRHLLGRRPGPAAGVPVPASVPTAGAGQHRHRHADGAGPARGARQDGHPAAVPRPRRTPSRSPPQLYGGRMRRRPDEVRHVLYEQERLGPSAGYFLQLLAGVGWTSLPALPLIRQPTMVLAGNDDPIIPLVNARIMNALLPHATLHVYDDGHLGLLTSADELGPLVSRFLTAPGPAA